MAGNKAKRPVLLAQPQRRSPNSEPAELMPVKAHVYRAIAELNGGFEKVIQDLQILGRISFFNPGGVAAMHNLICRIRAQANRQFTTVLHDREIANAVHFDQLCLEQENTPPPPKSDSAFPTTLQGGARRNGAPLWLC